jgi:2-dehydropantoate 2-reductase
MRILMFGRGVISALYGWTLQQAGHDVEFYVRPGRANEYGDTIDLNLLDARRRPWGRRALERWPVRYRESLEADHGFDLIVLSLPHHRLAEAATFLAPRVGDATVLVFGNVWAEPQDAVRPLPLDQLAWGFPQAGGGFDPDGVLRGVILPSVLFGTFGQPPTARELAAREVFRQAGFRLREESDFRGWLWLHFVFDAGMHAQGLGRGTLAQLVGSRADLRTALLTSRELLPVLQARGVDLRRHRKTTLPLRAPSQVAASAMALATRHVPAARASLEAHTDLHAQEPRVICRDALAEARRLGVEVPLLEAAEATFAVPQRP